MMRTVDLSADLGEGSPGEEEIWPLITSANVACGGHIGDATTMAAAVALAARWKVKLGAHPSYPDRENFGRKSLALAPSDLRVSLVEQLTALQKLATVSGMTLTHVKPHGALYNDAHHDPARAATIAEALQEVDPSLALVCPDASAMAKVARASGLIVIREAFADRRYAADGSLVPRSRPGSLLNVDEAAEQAALLISDGVVVTETGTRVPVAFDTICIHADMERAVERLYAVQQRIRGTGGKGSC